jgi:opacity protein-like surface antigen
MKSLIIAAAAAFIGLAAPASAQPVQPVQPAAESNIVLAGGGWDDHRPHWKKRHHNGFYFGFHHGGVFFDGPRYHRPHFHHPRPVIRLTRAHINWCYDHYRSYNHRTNTYVRSNGRVKVCVSPYLHR